MAISTNGTVLARVAGALYNTQMSNATYEEVKTLDPSSLADALFARDFSSATDATVATTLVTNLGLTAVEGLANWVAAQLTAAGSHKGAKVVELLNGFAQMSADATYGAAATAFNTKVDAALALSQTTGNAGGTFAAAGTVAANGGTFTLTTGNDVADNISASRGSLTSTFKFTSGDETVNASVGTLGDNDILLDVSTTDADVINLTGGSGTFSASNIETINLTTATAATLQLDYVTGVNNVNVTGTNTVTVDGFNASSLQPTIGINNITRAVTVLAAEMTGTTAAASAETVNLSVSGLSYGTTSSKQSVIAIDHSDAADTTTDVLETLNITSTGSTTNDFSLTVGDYLDLSTVNIKGDQSVQIRAATADITGLTINGADNTGTVTLRVDRNGATTTATNAANYTGVDDILLVDGTSGSDAGVVSSLQSGAKVTFGSSFTGADSSLSFQGATLSALKDSVTVVLDNVATTAAGVSLVKLDVQNVKTLNLSSAGHPTSSSTSGANLLNDLVGDFTTITITGDTSLEADLNIDATQTATSTSARTVVVNASGMTGDAFVNFTEIASNSKVGYNITGTANADSVTLNNTAGTVTGGAGNDTITGGEGNDSISLGDGDDTVVVSYGTDSVTGGEGNDTFDVNAIALAATKTKITADADGGTAGASAALFGTTVAADDDLIITINGVAYKQDILTNGDTADDAYVDWVATWGSSVLAAHGVVATADATGNVLTFEASSSTYNGFTVAVAVSDAGTVRSGTNTTNVTGAAAKDVAVVITDFSSTDVIDTTGITKNTTAKTAGGGGYYEGNLVTGFTDGADYDFIVLTHQAFADYGDAEAAIAGAHGPETDDVVFAFLNSTSGVVEIYFDTDLGADNDVGAGDLIASLTNITTLTGLASTFSSTSFIV